MANEPTIPLSLAKELLDLSQNRDDIVPAYTMNFSIRYRSRSVEEFQFVCAALRTNTTIESFRIFSFLHVLPASVFSKKAMDDLCYFVANNPSLKILELYDHGIYSDENEMVAPRHLANLVLEAAASNENLRRLAVTLPSFPVKLFHTKTSFPCLKELTVSEIPDSLIAEWPVNHSIETLQLGSVSSTSTLLLKLASSPASRSIRCLKLGDLNPSVSVFLQSANSSVRCLYIHRLMGSSGLDAFLKALAESRTTEMLQICFNLLKRKDFDRFLRAFKTKALPVRKLTIYDLEASCQRHAMKLLQCNGLSSLALPLYDRTVDNAKDGLVKSNFSHLHIQIDLYQRQQRLSLFSAPMKNVLTTLKSLTLTQSYIDQADVDLLVKAVTSSESQLESLHLDRFRDAGDRLRDAPGILQAKLVTSLRNAPCLRRLCVSDNLNSVQAIVEALEQASCIEHFEAKVQDGITSCLDEEKFEHSLLKNWSLESFSLSREEFCTEMKFIYEFQSTAPVISVAFRQKIDRIMRRNILKKEIFDSSASSTATKEDWFPKMKEFWKLPDGFSLCFWLLGEMPHVFFLNCSSRSIQRPTKRRRLT